MTEKLPIKSPERLQDQMSSEDVKRILGELLASVSEEDLSDLSEKIKNIKEFVLDKYKWSDCVTNPYWHALAGSTMKEVATISENPTPLEQNIIDTIIGSVKRLQESVATETVTQEAETHNSLISEVASFRTALARDPGVLQYFNQEMNNIIIHLQREYPDQNLSHIPEVQYIISGSEVKNGADIPETTTILVLESVKKAYLDLKRKIEETFLK